MLFDSGPGAFGAWTGPHLTMPGCKYNVHCKKKKCEVCKDCMHHGPKPHSCYQEDEADPGLPLKRPRLSCQVEKCKQKFCFVCNSCAFHADPTVVSSDCEHSDVKRHLFAKTLAVQDNHTPPVTPQKVTRQSDRESSRSARALGVDSGTEDDEAAGWHKIVDLAKSLEVCCGYFITEPSKCFFLD